MSKTFFIYNHRDAGDPYKLALIEAGYKEVQVALEADFILMDWDKEKYKGDCELFKNKKVPLFIYPHSPIHAMVAWDGLYPYYADVACNIAISEGQKQVMESYGYKFPIEVCGWAYPMADEYRYFNGDIPKVLFAPPHPNTHGTLKISKIDIDSANAVLEILTRLHKQGLISLTVRYGHSLERNELSIQEDIGIKLERAVYRHGDSVRSILEHDVVISNQTFAFLSVAMNTPTIMYDTYTAPHTVMGRYVSSWSKYRDFLRYPVELFKAENAWELIQKVCIMNIQSDWHNKFIGIPFNKQKFIQTIERYL